MMHYTPKVSETWRIGKDAGSATGISVRMRRVNSGTGSIDEQKQPVERRREPRSATGATSASPASPAS
jgi:hypothetical protein